LATAFRRSQLSAAIANAGIEWKVLGPLGLAKDRHEVESDLSRAYRDIVVKRTWLKLAENASPSIRAALQAYLNAIQKIGKGTGKRAVR
jgi:hypothetical protein